MSFATFAKIFLNFSLATKQLALIIELLENQILSIMTNQLVDNFESLKNSIFSTTKKIFFDERTLVSNTFFFDKYRQNDILKSKNILSNTIDVNILNNLMKIYQNQFDIIRVAFRVIDREIDKKTRFFFDKINFKTFQSFFVNLSIFVDNMTNYTFINMSTIMISIIVEKTRQQYQNNLSTIYQNRETKFYRRLKIENN